MTARLDVVQTTSELVRIPSVNPMGRSVQGDQYFEHAVTDYLESLFRRLGVRWERLKVADRRENIVACLEGSTPPSQGGPVLVFEAHQDTVPVEGMTIPPWEPQVVNGRIYGRGACDIKGGMASMLAAFSRLIVEKPTSRPTVVMACSVNEENGFDGAQRIATSWTEGTSSVVPRRPDAVIVAEPTRLDVVVAHKGTVRWRLHTRGVAAHSSMPDQGENAIYHMARVLGQLEHYARHELPERDTHPLLGRPTLSVGTIQGGISVNTVPDRCTIEIDRRVLPGESPLAARDDIIAFLTRQLSDVPIEHDLPYIAGSGLPDDLNGGLAEQLGAVARRYGGGKRIGVPYGTDAPAFAAVGIPAVVFGPGSIEQAHTKDEWVEIEQLEQAAEIYYEFARQFSLR